MQLAVNATALAGMGFALGLQSRLALARLSYEQVPAVARLVDSAEAEAELVAVVAFAR